MLSTIVSMMDFPLEISDENRAETLSLSFWLSSCLATQTCLCLDSSPLGIRQPLFATHGGSLTL